MKVLSDSGKNEGKGDIGWRVVKISKRKRKEETVYLLFWIPFEMYKGMGANCYGIALL